MSDMLLATVYLAAAILFVLGLKALNSPQTARRGILLVEIGMLFAVVGTLLRTVTSIFMVTTVRAEPWVL